MTGSALAVIGQVLLMRLSPHGNYAGEIVPSCLRRYSRATSRPPEAPSTRSSSPEMAIGSTSVPYRSKASTSRSVTGGSHQEAGEILGARPACREVGGDAG